ncbi:hypothetical protein [Piscinibacter sakaiensis]|uniref:hypothetical protein n=1 Tax=Piscinibacter sakaiensis TaxID=1547922 RepID=UPI003AAA627C
MLAFALLLLALALDVRADTSVAAPVWAVDPAEPGPDLPPRGRSLFDFVATTPAADGSRQLDLPFPFAALVARIETRAGCTSPCAKQVLIPLGRSLQRTAAAPDFFRDPRVVVAIDAEPAPRGALLKDRIYLGYQRQADLIEVISYNEAAARFEFQVVRDYRPGGTPRLSYARRALCVSCHQNHAAIFSRQLWDETNANPRIAARLEREHADYQGVRVRRGVDVPNAIDDASDRANLFGVWQLLWRRGCGDGNDGSRCRAALWLAALQYRLSDGRDFDRGAAQWQQAFVPRFERQWRALWPGGLAVANPDVPNRDPLTALRGSAAAAHDLVHVPTALEPLAPRPPLEVLMPTAQTASRLVAGLAQFLATADVAAIDAGLARLGGAVSTLRAPCTVEATPQWLRFDCNGNDADALQLSGRIDLDGRRIRSGKLRRLAVAGSEPLAQLDLAGSAAAGRFDLLPASGALNARLVDGRRIAAISLQLPGQLSAVRSESRGQAEVRIVDETEPLRQAAAELAAGRLADADQPFMRTALIEPLLQRLGATGRIDCCTDIAAMPPPQTEAPPPKPPTDGPAQPFAAFYPACAACHAGVDAAPPNFLAGTAERVAASIRQCAARIHVRLAQWQLDPAARSKTPMPPAAGRSDRGSVPPPIEIAGLQRLTAALLQRESGAVPDLGRLLAAGYEALPPCLADAGSHKQ